MTAFLIWGVYRGLWDYISIPDLVLYTKSVITGGLLSGLVVLVANQFSGPSRAVLILNPVLLLIAVSASRFSFRFMQSVLVGTRTVDAAAKPVLIYGAGDGGALLVRELLGNMDHHYTPVGFLDDDVRKIGKHFHGLPIFDPQGVAYVVRTSGIEEVLVSSWKIPEYKLDCLSAAGLKLKRMRLVSIAVEISSKSPTEISPLER
jgi:FlaA1/EpsC-like NDP-sugar epimerase